MQKLIDLFEETHGRPFDPKYPEDMKLLYDLRASTEFEENPSRDDPEAKNFLKTVDEALSGKAAPSGDKPAEEEAETPPSDEPAQKKFPSRTRNPMAPAPPTVKLKGFNDSPVSATQHVEDPLLNLDASRFENKDDIFTDADKLPDKLPDEGSEFTEDDLVRVADAMDAATTQLGELYDQDNLEHQKVFEKALVDPHQSFATGDIAPDSFSEAVKKRLESKPAAKSEAKPAAKPAAQPAAQPVAQPAAQPVDDGFDAEAKAMEMFQTVHGTSFDPKSSMDKAKLTTMAGMLKDEKNRKLSPTQFALQVYRNS